MTPEQFVYWLQGFAEINGSSPTEDQWKIIVEHLNTVFKKVTSQPKPINIQDILGNRQPTQNPPPIFPVGPSIVC